MTDKHYVDAEKLLEWAKVGLGSAKLYTKLAGEIESGRIDPDPPQQSDKPHIEWIKYDPKNPGELEEQNYLINLATRHLSTAAMIWAVYDAIDNMFYVETEFGKEGFRDYVSHYAVINTPGDVIS